MVEWFAEFETQGAVWSNFVRFSQFYVNIVSCIHMWHTQVWCKSLLCCIFTSQQLLKRCVANHSQCSPARNSLFCHSYTSYKASVPELITNKRLVTFFVHRRKSQDRYRIKYIRKWENQDNLQNTTTNFLLNSWCHVRITIYRRKVHCWFPHSFLALPDELMLFKVLYFDGINTFK